MANKKKLVGSTGFFSFNGKVRKVEIIATKESVKKKNIFCKIKPDSNDKPIWTKLENILDEPNSPIAEARGDKELLKQIKDLIAENSSLVEKLEDVETLIKQSNATREDLLKDLKTAEAEIKKLSK